MGCGHGLCQIVDQKGKGARQGSHTGDQNIIVPLTPIKRKGRGRRCPEAPLRPVALDRAPDLPAGGKPNAGHPNLDTLGRSWAYFKADGGAGIPAPLALGIKEIGPRPYSA